VFLAFELEAALAGAGLPFLLLRKACHFDRKGAETEGFASERVKNRKRLPLDSEEFGRSTFFVTSLSETR